MEDKINMGQQNTDGFKNIIKQLSDRVSRLEQGKNT